MELKDRRALIVITGQPGVYELDYDIDAREGSLVSAQEIGLELVPTGKYLVRKKERIPGHNVPTVITYHLEKF